MAPRGSLGVRGLSGWLDFMLPLSHPEVRNLFLLPWSAKRLTAASEGWKTGQEVRKDPWDVVATVQNYRASVSERTVATLGYLTRTSTLDLMVAENMTNKTGE